MIFISAQFRFIIIFIRPLLVMSNLNKRRCCKSTWKKYKLNFANITRGLKNQNTGQENNLISETILHQLDTFPLFKWEGWLSSYN